MSDFFKNLLGDSVNTIAADGSAAATQALQKEAEDAFGLPPSLTSKPVPAQVNNNPVASVPLAPGASGAVSQRDGITTEQNPAVNKSMLSKVGDFYKAHKVACLAVAGLVTVLVVMKYAKK